MQPANVATPATAAFGFAVHDKVAPPALVSARVTLLVSAAMVLVGGLLRSPLSAMRKLNVLLITIDSLRADMPWNGYARDIAPNLTAFEKKAVSYTHAYSISSYTAMSVAGLLRR